MRPLQGLGTQDLEGLASSWRIGQGDSEAGTDFMCAGLAVRVSFGRGMRAM